MLNSAQRNKLSDFSWTLSAGWFAAAIIAPFFGSPLLLTIEAGLRIMVGISVGMFFLWISLSMVKNE